MTTYHDWVTLRNCTVVTRGIRRPSCQVVLDRVTGKIADVRTFKQDEFDLTLHRSHDIDCRGHLLTAGFLDLQLNGACGMDFCTDASGRDYETGLEAVCRAVTMHGVTGFCATLITSPAETYHEIVPKLTPRRMAGGAQLLGAHLEGPFLNPDKHGIHQSDWMQSPDQDVAEIYGPDFARHTAIVTLAPELPGALALIQQLTQQGIVVSMGHSAATLAVAQEAQAHGASMLTHLFNAMSPIQHRSPTLANILGTPTPPFFGLIADDIHVSASAAALAYKAHPAGCCLVTDANSPLQQSDGAYIGPHGTFLTKKGLAATTHTGDIGGGACPLDQCLRNLLESSGRPIEQVVQTVNEHPAQVLKRNDCGVVEKGFMADLVLMTEAGQVLKTFVAGKQVYSKTSW